MKGLILVGGLVLLVGCKSHKKATAEYEAYLAEVKGSTEKVETERGEMNELSTSDRSEGAQTNEDAQKATSTTQWPGQPEAETKKIVVKQEEASLLSGEDGSMGNFKYYVIIGSFANENNARNYKQSMVDKGFTPVILENKSGYFRVSVYQTNEEAAARNQIQHIRNKYPEHMDVWLLMKK